MAKTFIQKAIKKPGALESDLKRLGLMGKKSEKVPLSGVKQAAKMSGKVGERARFYLQVLRPASRGR